MRKLVLAFALVASACAHGSSGTHGIVRSVSPTEALVQLSRAEASIGDDVVFTRNVCGADPRMGPYAQQCEKRVVARGRVVGFQGDDYATVRLHQGNYESSDHVERAPAP